jgi:hypothetical protein
MQFLGIGVDLKNKGAGTSQYVGVFASESAIEDVSLKSTLVAEGIAGFPMDVAFAPDESPPLAQGNVNRHLAYLVAVGRLGEVDHPVGIDAGHVANGFRQLGQDTPKKRGNALGRQAKQECKSVS